MNADWYHLHFLHSVPKRIAISLSNSEMLELHRVKFGKLLPGKSSDDRDHFCRPICRAYLYRVKTTYTPWFVVLPFRNATQYWNADGRINSGDDHATRDINLVGYWPVPPKFTQINCVQQASVSTLVSISTFIKWQHGYFSLLFARGRHCDAERAIR